MIRTLRGWAISVLQEAGAICECEEHGWMQDRGDPHARQSAFDIARKEPPCGLSLRSKRSQRFGICWTRSAIPARSARRPECGPPELDLPIEVFFY